jgi:hypothetical protein
MPRFLAAQDECPKSLPDREIDRFVARRQAA